MTSPNMYLIKKSNSLLSQGDFFIRFETKELPKSEDKELGFIVLTYTCDLEHPEDLNYIQICPVYDFSILIKKFLEKNKNKSIEKIKNALKSRIHNFFNNESRFYFFLSPISEFNSTPAYADLAQIIKIHKKFTEKIIENRIISLELPWREKLGWMTGNLFNRIALADVKKTESANYIEMNELIKTFFQDKIHEIEKSFKEYLDLNTQNVQIIKDILLKLCLEHNEITRDMLKEEVSKRFTESDIESIFEKISTELNSKNNSFLQEIIMCEKKHHKLDNFRIHESFKPIIKDILEVKE